MAVYITSDLKGASTPESRSVVRVTGDTPGGEQVVILGDVVGHGTREQGVHAVKAGGGQQVAAVTIKGDVVARGPFQPAIGLSVGRGADVSVSGCVAGFGSQGEGIYGFVSQGEARVHVGGDVFGTGDAVFVSSMRSSWQMVEVDGNVLSETGLGVCAKSMMDGQVSVQVGGAVSGSVVAQAQGDGGSASVVVGAGVEAHSKQGALQVRDGMAAVRGDVINHDGPGIRVRLTARSDAWTRSFVVVEGALASTEAALVLDARGLDSTEEALAALPTVLVGSIDAPRLVAVEVGSTYINAKTLERALRQSIRYVEDETGTGADSASGLERVFVAGKTYLVCGPRAADCA